MHQTLSRGTSSAPSYPGPDRGHKAAARRELHGRGQCQYSLPLVAMRSAELPSYPEQHPQVQEPVSRPPQRLTPLGSRQGLGKHPVRHAEDELGDPAEYQEVHVGGPEGRGMVSPDSMADSGQQ